jgi:hypothetical protein
LYKQIDSLSSLNIINEGDFNSRKHQIKKEVLSKDEQEQMELMGNSILRKHGKLTFESNATFDNASKVLASTSMNISKNLNTSRLLYSKFY